MTWFEQLFGFAEGDWETTRARFEVEGETMSSRSNDRAFTIGRFATPSVAELRRGGAPGSLRVSHEVIGDVLELHARPENRGATFQVASQLNCLEFVGPSVVPEDGVTGYAHDPTQGPACALAAGAATVYRNYLVPIGPERGQRRDRQLDTLSDVRAVTGGFTVRNGYTFSTVADLRALCLDDRDDLLDRVRIGTQSRVGVTFARRWVEPSAPTEVSQAFCSAVSCAYSGLPTDAWAPLATLVLDAAYEATLRFAAIDRAEARGSGKVWLTLLGGGVFGNRPEWIAGAIGRALRVCEDLDLDVRVAHYRRLDEGLVARIDAARRAS